VPALTRLQNLIALFFRPFRLILPSETLRSARIVVLKTTHFPVVAAIWAFESGVQYLADRRAHRSSWMSSIGGPESSSPSKRNTLRSSLRTPRPLAAAAVNQASVNGGPRAVRAGTDYWNSRPTSRTFTESHEDLRSLVVKLSAQVESLTAIVAEQRHQKSPRSEPGEA